MIRLASSDGLTVAVHHDMTLHLTAGASPTPPTVSSLATSTPSTAVPW